MTAGGDRPTAWPKELPEATPGTAVLVRPHPPPPDLPRSKGEVALTPDGSAAWLIAPPPG